MIHFSKFGIGLHAKLTLELHSNFPAEISCRAISIPYSQRTLFIYINRDKRDLFPLQFRGVVLPENFVQKTLKLIDKILFREEFPEGNIYNSGPGDSFR